MDKKDKKDKTVDKKNKKKKKKGISFIRCCDMNLLCLFNRTLSASLPDSSNSDDNDEDDSEGPPDVEKQSFFKIPAKDLNRSPGQATVEDLSLRQFCYCVSGVLPCVLPSDLLEIGGECDLCLQLFCCEYALEWQLRHFQLHVCVGPLK